MIKGQREGEGEREGTAGGGRGDEKAVFKGFVVASTGLRRLRVYCKSRPHAREERGRGDGQEQGTSNKPKTVSISDGTPPDDRIPADRKTTGQRRFWKIGSVGITKLHISSGTNWAWNILCESNCSVQIVLGGGKTTHHMEENVSTFFWFVTAFSFPFVLAQLFVFRPPLSGIRACLDGNQTMHCLAAGFMLSRWNVLGGNHSFPLWCDCVYTFCLKLLDEDYEKIQTPVARDDLISKYTLTQVTFLQFWS